MATRKNVNVDIDALIEDVTQIDEISDRVRIAGYGLASPLLKMREAQMRREVDRVAARKGADHPEVAARTASLKRTEERRVLFDEELSRARIDRVKLTRDDSAGIYGRVAEDGKPLENVTVIAHANNERVDFTCTKENGAFSMEVPAETEVVISVRADDGAELYRDPKGTVLQPGEQRFKEIDMRRAPAEPCPDPVDEEPQDDTLIMVDLVGQTEADAVGIISTQGLTLGKRTTRPVDEGVGIVLEQDPQAGTVVRRGDVVDIVVGRSNMVAVPDLTGLTPDQAREVLVKHELQLGQVSTVSARADQAGLVVDQDPAPDSSVNRRSAVSIDVGDENEVTVPNLIGRTEEDGMAILEEVGLQSGEVKTIPVSAEKAGLIVDQDPPPGDRVPRGASVSITVGRADEVTVPNIIGRTEDEGTKILKKSELTVGERSTRPAPAEKVGLILSQDPAAGRQVMRGSAVSIVIGRIIDVEVPDLRGLSEDEGGAKLKEAGLQLGQVSTTAVQNEQEVGMILSQDPAAGTRVNQGTAVSVVVGELTDVIVPDVVKMSLEEAREELGKATLRVGHITWVTVPREHVRKVLSQKPEAGSRVQSGAMVHMKVGTIQSVEFVAIAGRAEKQMRESGFSAIEEQGFLAERLEAAGIATIPELEEFLGQRPQEIRDRLKFRNLTITRQAIVAMKQALGSV